MKKQITNVLLFLLCTTLVFAQSGLQTEQQADYKTQLVTKESRTAFTGDETLINTERPIWAVPESRQMGVGVVVGTTTYDLQTNNSICDRIWIDDEGTAHIVWTYSNTFDSAASDRGTGYNTVTADGTIGDFPTERLEADRNGWPSIGVAESGRIFSVSHFAGATSVFGGLSWAYKDPGEEWVAEAFPVGNEDDTWARVAVDGNTIHVIAGRPRADGDEICGLIGGLAYYRSTDGGLSWEDNACIPGIDSNNFNDLSGDGYAIDAHDGTVAIVCGSFQATVLISNDGGDTWDEPVVTNPIDIPLFDGNQDLDISVTTDESYEILVDNDGVVHVWFGRVLILDDNDAAGWSVFPDNNGIMYWNSATGGIASVIGETVRRDVDGDNVFDFDFNTSESNLYFNNLVSMPSAGIDADGTIYVTFSSIVEGAVDENNNFFRDLFIMKSSDGGANWEGPLNITNDPTEEAVYASVARRVDDNVHIVYQSDAFPGITFRTEDVGYVHPFILNEIRYVQVPVADIVTPEPDFFTNPQLLVTSVPNAIQDCEIGIDRFDAFCIDYPDGNLIDEVMIGGTVDVTVPALDTYTWELSVTDSDGNATIDELLDTDGNPIVVSVFEDVDAPLVEGNPAEFIIETDGIFLESTFAFFDTIEVVVDTPYEDLGAVTFDESDDIFGCTVNLIIDNPVDTSTPGEYTVVYTAEDVAGNISEPVNRLVRVIAEDLVPPQIILFDEDGNEFPDGGDYNVQVSLGGTWEEPGFFAFDNVDIDITDNVVIGGDAVNLEEVGSYLVTYTVSDAAGNESVVSRNVIVEDTQAPQINLIPPASQPIVLQCEQNIDFTDPSFDFNGTLIGFTAVDNVDGDLTVEVEVEADEFCPLCAGSYTVTYNVCDSNGNCSDEVNRTVIVVAPCNIDCSGDCFVGVNDPVFEAQVSVYPNPASNVINIDVAANVSAVSITAYDTKGQIVFAEENAATTTTIDATNFASGVYYLTISSDAGTAVKKVVVE